LTPALTISSRIAATLVARRPLTIFAEIGTQPAWQIADKGNRFASVIESPHQGKHGLRAPQLVRCVTAGDDQRVKIIRGDPPDRAVDRHRPVAFLPRNRLVIQTGHGYRDVLFAQTVQRVQQLHVLELISSEKQDAAPRKHHGMDSMPGR
jgi:hypothetical protein